MAKVEEWRKGKEKTTTKNTKVVGSSSNEQMARH